jgi:hypothetical protein
LRAKRSSFSSQFVSTAYPKLALRPARLCRLAKNF